MGLKYSKKKMTKNEMIVSEILKKKLKKARVGPINFTYVSRTELPTIYRGVSVKNPEVLKSDYFKNHSNNLIISMVDDEFFVDNEDQTISFFYKINEDGSLTTP